ncbi:GFA family protein [Sphingomonas sp.]|uniref:GFA family protein n=1 Tax=Sphingomonas sp. TaxID=28214 RepID=UPI00286DB784|nr:GFA family protein [Sphingomonas sp.]
MTVRTASCRCGQMKITATGEPVRVSACHCLDCQQRSGSAFAVQARWPVEQMEVAGEYKSWVQTADSGNRITFHFCPECGSPMHYVIDGKFEGLVAIPVGAFADPSFPPPTFSVWERRKHPWVEISGDKVEHSC